jgi:hypothetical protein
LKHDERLERKKVLETESMLAIGKDDILSDEKMNEFPVGNKAGHFSEELKSPELHAAVSRVGSETITGQLGSSGTLEACTLHADTVHFNVDSMDLKNGSVVIELIGRGYRNGTSEQR